MTQSARTLGIMCGALMGALSSCAAIGAEPAACDSYQAAVTGGPLPPPDSDTVVIRWLANANYEFAYKGKVYLFDAYFDRVARNRDLGFKAAQVTKADAIFVSHAHFDHIAYLGPVARQTGARVVGAPITAATAIKLGAPEKQVVSVKGGETLKYGDATVEIALAQHSTIPPGLVEAYGALHKIETREDTPQEREVTAQVRSRGTFDPDIITKGTLAYALVFPNGFKAVLVGSAGPITDGVRELARKIGPVDIAIIAYQPHAVAERQIRDTWPFIELFKPKLFLPAHHDQSFGVWLDLGLEPLFSKLRDEMPETKFLAPLYRSPICVATSGPNRGAVVSFKY
jgi:L-ascorbate metabolism protein UlaG (beta-lactamase superfamily)